MVSKLEETNSHFWTPGSIDMKPEATIINSNNNHHHLKIKPTQSRAMKAEPLE